MTVYQVWFDDKCVYDTRIVTNPEACLLTPRVKRRLNSHPGFVFGLTSAHPQYGALVAQRTRVQVVRDETDVLFTGRPLLVETDFDGTQQWTCEGGTAWLCDTVQRPWEWGGTLEGFLQMIINTHNTQADGHVSPLWELGIVTVTDPNDYIARSSGDWLSTWEVLKTRLLDSELGGYLLARPGAGTMILDYVATPGGFSGQTIEVGQNLLALNQILDTEGLITRLIPLGARLDGLEEDDNHPPVNGPVAVSRVTIESVNDGRDYIQDDTLIASLGIHMATRVFDDRTLPANVLTAGAAALTEAKQAALSMSLTAVDLCHLGVAAGPLDCGMTVDVVVPHLGIDMSALITEDETPLDSADKRVKIGAVRKTWVELDMDARRAAADQVTELVVANYRVNEAVTSVSESVAQVRVTAEGAKTSATGAATAAASANSAAQAAQSAANTAQTAANTAQSTANTAKTNAATAASAAAQAQTTATTAKTDAAAAAGIANGKGDVVIQGSAPGAGLQKPTTLWIDTTGGLNTPKRWSGSAWVAVTDKAATDAAAAAVVAQSKATTAQATADTAKANAATAQSAANTAQATANTAKTNAATAQAAADAAKAAAAIAQSTADGAGAAALGARDVYSRDASQGLTGLTWEGSGAGVQGATAVVADTTALKGKMIQKQSTVAGNLWLHDPNGRIPLKQGVVYEVYVTARVPQAAATGTCYFGVDGLRLLPDGKTWQYVNYAGANNPASSQHYIAWCGLKARSTAWETYRGYFRLAPASITNGDTAAHPSPSDPAWIHPAATHVQPMMLMSYSGKPDLVQISDWGITIVSGTTQDQLTQNTHAIAQTTANLTTAINQSSQQVMIAADAKFATISTVSSLEEEFQAALSVRADEILLSIAETVEQMNIINGTVASDRAERERLIRAALDGLTIGLAGSPSQVRVDEDSVDILRNGVLIAQFATKTLVDQLLIDTSLQIGKYLMKDDGSGGLAVVWVG